ncbi:MAG: hypothetical protein ABI042_05195 [Verrucomicrobiota bacterium]
MRSSALRLTMIFAAVLSLLWLVGYARALRPFAGDFLRDGDFNFLTYPAIKIYRIADASTGTMSPRRIDFFSTDDGPTGIEYNESYFPCWIVSLGAFAGLFAGGYSLLSYNNTRV